MSCCKTKQAGGVDNQKNVYIAASAEEVAASYKKKSDCCEGTSQKKSDCCEGTSHPHAKKTFRKARLGGFCGSDHPMKSAWPTFDDSSSTDSDIAVAQEAQRWATRFLTLDRKYQSKLWLAQQEFDEQLEEGFTEAFNAVMEQKNRADKLAAEVVDLKERLKECGCE